MAVLIRRLLMSIFEDHKNNKEVGIQQIKIISAASNKGIWEEVMLFDEIFDDFISMQ